MYTNVCTARGSNPRNLAYKENIQSTAPISRLIYALLFKITQRFTQVFFEIDSNSIIISLLMPSLWITHKENGPKPSTRAQYGLVGFNDCI
jgi:hypothetical protein